jgi:hypothetical protein
VAHARDGAERVGARAQVRDLPQELGVCCFGWIGYVSGSSTKPTAITSSAWISNAWPLPWLCTSVPRQISEHPVERRCTSDA